MIHQRTLAMAELVVEAVCQEEHPGASCLQLEREGFWRRPGWEALRGGERPLLIDGEPGEWPHGWQLWASSRMLCCHTERLLVKFISDHIQDATLAQLWRLPQQVSNSPSLPTSARAREVAFATPHHGGSATVAAILSTLTATTGRHVREQGMKKRATPTERVLARMFRETGARVRFNAFET